MSLIRLNSQTFKLTDYTVVITQTKENIFINITNRNNYKIYEKTISIYDGNRELRI